METPQGIFCCCFLVGWFAFLFLSFFFFCFCFFVLGPYLQYVEIPRLGVQSDLQLPAYTTATATRDLSCICHLHHSSWQCWNLNPLSEARDQTCILMDTSWIHFCYSTVGTPQGTLEWEWQPRVEIFLFWTCGVCSLRASDSTFLIYRV